MVARRVQSERAQRPEQPGSFATEPGAWAAFITGIAFVVLGAAEIIDVPYYYIVGLIPALVAYVAVSLMTREDSTLPAG